MPGTALTGVHTACTFIYRMHCSLAGSPQGKDPTMKGQRVTTTLPVSSCLCACPFFLPQPLFKRELSLWFCPEMPTRPRAAAAGGQIQVWLCPPAGRGRPCSVTVRKRSCTGACRAGAGGREHFPFPPPLSPEA